VAQCTPESSVATRLFVFQTRPLLLAPVGILHLTSIYDPLISQALPFLPSHTNIHSKHRILDLLEALNTALHLLRRRIVSSLRMFVDIQLVMFVVAAFVFSLHDVLP
jgi:hypothetical protein